MSHIVSFAVAGLAGRDEVYRQKLDRHVNIFFGLNGTGKTSLLKLLHAALEGDGSMLKSIPFKWVEVEIYSISHDETFTVRAEKPKGDDDLSWLTPAAAAKALEGFSGKTTRTQKIFYREYTALIQGAAAWKLVRGSEAIQERYENFVERGWQHSYLPTSRMYMASGIEGLSLGTNTRGQTTEEVLDQYFARVLEARWAKYSAEVLSRVQKAQADGLAAILKDILSTKTEKESNISLSDRTFERVSAFLQRQGSTKALGSRRSFERHFSENPQLRKVVEDIDKVEGQVESALAPREKLQKLIAGMLSGHKRVAFEDTGIRVERSSGGIIDLTALSSGEKQLLRILVEALLAESNTMIVDEPELSMHIDWQLGLVRALRQLNPGCQLILATHSPEIMAETDDKNIFRL